MTTNKHPHFDVDTLRKLAGDKVFARGKGYFGAGQVEILAIEPTRVLAQVAGTEDYRTDLRGRGKAIDGDCSCPAFVDWGFCKHMVAVALTVNAMGNDAEAEGTLARVRAHLKDRGIDALVDMIMDMVERDPVLLRKLDTASAANHADEKTLETRLRKAIDRAVRTLDYIDYRGAGAWAAGVEEALDAVADLVSNGRAELALKLVDRAISGIEEAIESIDDSDGHCSALLHRASDIHLAAVRAARPDPVELARTLFTREMRSDYGSFLHAATEYADALGEAGLAELRRLATEAWEVLPCHAGKGRSGDEPANVDLNALKGILDYFAEQDGDVDARIALRAKNLSSPWSYLQLAEFCLAQGRREEALRRAEEGLWVFEDSEPDSRLILFTVKLLTKAGRKADAEAHLWRAFEKAPSIELYEPLRKLGGEAARDRAAQSLEDKVANGSQIGWLNVPDLLIEILTREKMFDAAWRTAHHHKASMRRKLALAAATESTHRCEALAVYCEHVNRLVDGSGNSAYEEAVKLVRRMARLQSANEQASYVATLKERFGRRRNFMKLLG